MDESASVFTLSDANGILEFWRDFNLDGRREGLDKQCLEMREMKTASMNGRKHLNELTKTFRSRSKDEQLGMVTEVLKAYQEEIDQLSRRAKFSESSFYTLYKSIFEAPDPCKALDGLVHMLTSTSTNQLEIERLRSELLQYDQEFQQLKNQDITIRRLEDQLAEFRNGIEDKVQEEVNRRTTEVDEASATKVSECRELQRAAEKRLAAAVESMRQAQASADRAQTQLFEVSSQAEQRTSALLSENSILAEANERTAARCVELETEAEVLRAQALARATEAAGGDSSTLHSSGGVLLGLPGSLSSGTLAREEETSTLHALVAELRSELRRKEETHRSDKARLESSGRDAAAALSREREAATLLRQELGERPRKEELAVARRQLRVLQRVLFNVEDGDGDGDVVDDPENTSESAQLETLLTTRLKGLEAELAEARSKMESSTKGEAETRASCEEAKKKLDASLALVAKLEGDLEAAQRHHQGGGGTKNKKDVANTGFGGPSAFAARPEGGHGHGLGASSVVNRGGAGGNGGNGGVEGDFGSLELSELLGVAGVGTGSGAGAGAGAGIGAGAEAVARPEGQAGQMISILQAQRDRYKTRLAASEANALQLQQVVSTLTVARKQAEDDNLALYAKLRFLQSKEGAGGLAGGHGHSPQAMRIRLPSHSGPSHAQSSSAAQGASGRDGPRADPSDPEGHYGAIYEQRLNPFAEFGQRERQLRLERVRPCPETCFAWVLIGVCAASLQPSIPSPLIIPPTYSPPSAVGERPSGLQRSVLVYLAQVGPLLPSGLPGRNAYLSHGSHLVAHAPGSPRL